MRRLPRPGLAAILLVAVALPIAACGEEEELDVIEGEPVELGELLYNVQITRFLNPNDPEDEAYLGGQPQAAADEEYLAVFMTIQNEGDESVELPHEMTIRDTRDNTYDPLESESVYALELGSAVPAGGDVPEPDTPAASGPINGAMVLFRVGRTVTENRPIELEIPGDAGEEGRVELDI
ncbi:MAG: hypothetical protein ACRDMA_12555 [Solirubrobacterales bacterium]